MTTVEGAKTAPALWLPDIYVRLAELKRQLLPFVELESLLRDERQVSAYRHAMAHHPAIAEMYNLLKDLYVKLVYAGLHDAANEIYKLYDSYVVKTTYRLDERDLPAGLTFDTINAVYNTLNKYVKL
ncbi:MAG: hypothetical protein ACK4SY_07605 [Pyrobaculum sp.]